MKLFKQKDDSFVCDSDTINGKILRNDGMQSTIRIKCTTGIMINSVKVSTILQY